MKSNEQAEAWIEAIRETEGPAFHPDMEAIFNAQQQKEPWNSGIGIKVLSVLGGFLASLAFTGFLLIAGLYDSAGGLLLVGLLFAGGALWISRAIDTLWIGAAGISAYLTGFVLIGFAMEKWHVDENALCLVLTALATVSFFLTRQYLLCFIAILVVTGSLLALILMHERPSLIHRYIWLLVLALSVIHLQEARLLRAGPGLAQRYEPLRMGLIVAFIAALSVVGVRDLLLNMPHHLWLSSIGSLVAILVVITKIPSPAGTVKSPFLYAAVCIVLLPGIFAPAMMGALLIVALSFYGGYRSSLVLGFAAFLFFLCRFYYDLYFTLLVKSGMLFASGILFLLLSLYIQKKIRAYEKL